MVFLAGSSSGKVLSEEEKAAENVYIKMFHFSHNLILLIWHLHVVCIPSFLGPGQLSVDSKSLGILYVAFAFAVFGIKPEEQAATSAGGSGSVADAAPSAQASSTPRVSNDKYRNYGVLAGLITGVGALGWYLLSKDKKAEEVQD
ncbi:hypothetical protein HAX54_004579 [Datura stramonium]|uniref:Uncharacterized protein n=1 Tax=Datura stramonium TaxID=4076 RepID=A0ABS8T896_DATST|nr:hypothetical protein [Datura stramonium]